MLTSKSLADLVGNTAVEASEAEESESDLVPDLVHAESSESEDEDEEEFDEARDSLFRTVANNINSISAILGFK